MRIPALGVGGPQRRFTYRSLATGGLSRVGSCRTAGQTDFDSQAPPMGMPVPRLAGEPVPLACQAIRVARILLPEPSTNSSPAEPSRLR